MQLFPALRIAILVAACLFAQGQTPPGKERQPEVMGMEPRVTPADYPDQAQAGAVTVAAEFQGHSIPTPDGPLTTEEFVVVETGLYGAPGARLQLSPGDFTLRVNEKRILPSLPYGMVIASVKDPQWQPPEEQEKEKSKSSLSTGGDNGGMKTGEKEPPFPPKVPIELQRAWAARVHKASLPEGDRALPAAGLIYFEYRGKTTKMHSLELIYAGPAGKATLTLEP